MIHTFGMERWLEAAANLFNVAHETMWKRRLFHESTTLSSSPPAIPIIMQRTKDKPNTNVTALLQRATGDSDCTILIHVIWCVSQKCSTSSGWTRKQSQWESHTNSVNGSFSLFVSLSLLLCVRQKVSKKKKVTATRKKKKKFCIFISLILCSLTPMESHVSTHRTPQTDSTANEREKLKNVAAGWSSRKSACEFCPTHTAMSVCMRARALQHVRQTRSVFNVSASATILVSRSLNAF